MDRLDAEITALRADLAQLEEADAVAVGFKTALLRSCVGFPERVAKRLTALGVVSPRGKAATTFRLRVPGARCARSLSN